MISVVRSRRMSTPAADVWAALAEFDTIARWAPNVDHSCLMSDQAQGVGMVRRIQTGRTTVVERVTEWSPGSALVYRLEGLPPVLRSVSNRWTIEPVADGDSTAVAITTVSITTEIDAGPRPPQQLVGRAVGRRMASASDAMLEGLDRHLAEVGVVS